MDRVSRIKNRFGITARAIADIKGLKIAGVVVDLVYDTIRALRAGSAMGIASR